jgi:hypothetical protein
VNADVLALKVARYAGAPSTPPGAFNELELNAAARPYLFAAKNVVIHFIRKQAVTQRFRPIARKRLFVPVTADPGTR